MTRWGGFEWWWGFEPISAGGKSPSPTYPDPTQGSRTPRGNTVMIPQATDIVLGGDKIAVITRLAYRNHDQRHPSYRHSAYRTRVPASVKITRRTLPHLVYSYHGPQCQHRPKRHSHSACTRTARWSKLSINPCKQTNDRRQTTDDKRIPPPLSFSLSMLTAKGLIGCLRKPVNHLDPVVWSEHVA